MHIEYSKLTGDGILAFFGGALAVLGLWRTNRSSIRDLERTRREDLARRRKALATALLFEIWDFYCYHVKPALAKAEGSSAERVKFFHRSFDIWKSNADQIGQFDADLVKELVHFHDVASEYFAVYERYFQLENDTDKQTVFFREHLAPKLPRLKGLAEKAWLRLCPVAGIELQSLRCDASGSGDMELGVTVDKLRQVPIERR